MAPIKRARAHTDGGDSEGIDLESASSGIRQTHNKRQRLSTLNGDASSDVDEYDSTGRHEESSDQDNDFQKTRRNTGFEDLGNEDADDARATQLVGRHFREPKQNIAADNGIIEEVECFNFMCHTHLRVKLGPLINFIIGHNGSGKSAVLTALTLCLGAKATSTNRGGSLKSFIKEGQERIKNLGDNAYQPELYGRSITVERHFSITGASGFKIKSADQRIISTKKADLEDIADCFALQLDNPMNVLTQDMARQFLSNSTPHDKYKFFIKGTQLEQLDRDYRLLEETIDSIESRCGSGNQNVADLEAKAKAARRKMELSDRHQSLRDKIRNYGRQMAWAQVEEQERHLARLDTEIQEAERKIEQVTSNAESAATTLEAADTVHEAGMRALNELRTTLVPQEDALRDAKDRFNLNKTELTDVHTQQRTIQQALRVARTTVEKTNRDIVEEHQRLQAANGGDHIRRLGEIEQAKEEAEELKRRFEAHGQELGRLDQDRQNAEQKLRDGRPIVDDRRDAVRKCESLLDSLSRDRGQHLAAYHRNMPNLLRAVNAETRFHEKPVGPIGQHVRLLEPEWSSIIETTFGNTLESFVVTNRQDQHLLRELMGRTQCVYQILIGDRQPIDTSRSEPDENLATIMRVIEIDNDLVRNQLIINQAIEQTVLIPDRNDAFRFMYESGGRPRNVKVTICHNANKRGAGIRLTIGRGGDASSPVTPWERPPRIKTDIESQIRIQRDTLQQLKRDLNDAENNFRQLQADLEKCKQALERHKRQERDLRLQSQRADERAERLRDELEVDTPKDGTLDTLQALLRDAEEENEQHSHSYQDAVVAKDRLGQLGKQLKDEVDTAQTAIEETVARISKAEAKVQTAAQKRQDALYEKNNAYARIEDAKSDKVRVENARQRQADKVASFEVDAGRISPRVAVDPGETPTTLDAKLTKLQKDLERYQQERVSFFFPACITLTLGRLGGTREELNEACVEAEIKYKTAKKQLDDLHSLSQSLKFTLLDRKSRWLKFRRFISSRARIMFVYLLSEREFRGKLVANHEHQELDVSIEPDISRNSDKGRQTKTLSGGEKSFSTICLLLSLWDAMGSPIRCLDEFDVFMDNVNRDVSMKMMIGAARRSVSRQFILITPQAMGNVQLQEDVNIIKMTDPERGQTTLPFSR